MDKGRFPGPSVVLSLWQWWRWLDGRDHVIPEDIQNVLPPVAGHRLHTASREGGKALHGQELVAQLIAAVKLP